MNDKFIEFPKWMYGPDGEAQIFEKEEDIPQGWVDHPSKFEKKEEVEDTLGESPEPKRKSKK